MTHAIIDSARNTLNVEADALRQLADALNDKFVAATQAIAAVKGRVIVSGMGKSGHIGKKITATLASTGTPASFVHPGEASHGDLGMITADDIILALSWSGGTTELTNLLNYAKRFAIPLIAITSDETSLLGSHANICLTLPKAAEACPNGLAPTTSTTMQLALGDALAVALLQQRKFSASDFQVFHPGGKLGAGLLPVRDIMHKADALPLATQDTKMQEALIIMNRKSFGCLGIINDKGALIGIITDGDLRRHITPDVPNFLNLQVDQVMTAKPKIITGDKMSGEALRIMNDNNIQCLFVCENNQPEGLVRILDLLKLGVA
ncbi:MAG: KpsF/GutQ family sugar-phosphate isomerase [Parvibaculales bacterium]